jgi:uncharacterized membrane protein
MAQPAPVTERRSPVRFALARTRGLIAFALGLATFGVAMSVAPWQVAVLAGWSVSATVTVCWTLFTVWPLDSGETRAVATREDDSRAVFELVLVLAALASLAAIGVALLKAAKAKGSAEAMMVALAVVTVMLSWTAVHVTYMLRYAHVYYSEGGGVDFNEDDDPDYRDFAYLAFTIGMTFQVSDTDLKTKSIRRAATRHALLSYLFGVVIIAMAINVVAGLLNK